MAFMIEKFLHSPGCTTSAYTRGYVDQWDGATWWRILKQKTETNGTQNRDPASFLLLQIFSRFISSSSNFQSRRPDFFFHLPQSRPSSSFSRGRGLLPTFFFHLPFLLPKILNRAFFFHKILPLSSSTKFGRLLLPPLTAAAFFFLLPGPRPSSHRSSGFRQLLFPQILNRAFFFHEIRLLSSSTKSGRLLLPPPLLLGPKQKPKSRTKLQ